MISLSISSTSRSDNHANAAQVPLPPHVKNVRLSAAAVLLFYYLTPKSTFIGNALLLYHNVHGPVNTVPSTVFSVFNFSREYLPGSDTTHLYRARRYVLYITRVRVCVRGRVGRRGIRVICSLKTRYITKIHTRKLNVITRCPRASNKFRHRECYQKIGPGLFH